MEPEIRYARSSDGVNIAYATVGQGSPIVAVAGSMSHVQIEWAHPTLRRAYELLAVHHTLIRFDHRGLGLSDREVDDFSLETRLRDIDAVVAAAGCTRFILTGTQHGGLAAIAYAARHPEAISHLILTDAFSNGEERVKTPQGHAMAELLKGDWEMWTENVGALALGWGREESRLFGQFVRAAVAGDAYRRMFEDHVRTDVTELLPMIAAPTLIVKHSGVEYVSMEMTRRLASGIPNAKLVVVEGKLTEAVDQVQAAVDEFLGDAPAVVRERSGPSTPSSLLTVLFTDLVGHTDMMSRLGDEAGRDVLREHERITREVLKANGGTEVKTMGDGFMASFGSVTKAVECAIALQRAFAEREGEPLNVRVGLNAGEPIEEDGDLFGATVILASRIAAKAGGGEILVADTVRGLCSGKGFLFSDRGEFVAKGFEEPVRVYEVGWRS